VFIDVMAEFCRECEIEIAILDLDTGTVRRLQQLRHNLGHAADWHLHKARLRFRWLLYPNDSACRYRLRGNDLDSWRRGPGAASAIR
jgi:hypothetical protein